MVDCRLKRNKKKKTCKDKNEKYKYLVKKKPKKRKKVKHTSKSYKKKQHQKKGRVSQTQSLVVHVHPKSSTRKARTYKKPHFNTMTNFKTFQQYQMNELINSVRQQDKKITDLYNLNKIKYDDNTALKEKYRMMEEENREYKLKFSKIEKFYTFKKKEEDDEDDFLQAWDDNDAEIEKRKEKKN